MWPYYVLVFLPVLITLLFLKNKNRNRIAIISFFSILIILVSLRNKSIGSDTGNYWFLYDMLNDTIRSSMFKTGEYEYGFLLYTRLCTFIKYDFQLYLTITAFLSLIPILILYGKKSEGAILSIAIFLVLGFFRLYFSGIRQGLAIMWVVPAFYFCKEKKLLPFLATVFMAFVFHHSAFIMLLMYPLCWMKLDRKALLFIFPALFAVYLLRVSLFATILPFLGEKFEETYGDITETGAIMMLLLLVLLMVFAFLIPDEKKLDRETLAMRNFLVISTFLQVFAGVSTIAMRINYYFFLFIPLVIPKVISIASNNLRFIAKFGGAIISVVFIGYYFYGAITGADNLELYPYIFYWMTD